MLPVMVRSLAITLVLTGCGSLSTANAPTAYGTATGGTGTGTGTGTGNGGTTTGSIGPDGCQAIDELPGEGQTCELASDLLGPIDDSGGPVEILTGNLHSPNDVDWFLIDAVDLEGDEGRGYEDFRLHLQVSTGAADIEIQVLRGDCSDAGTLDSQEGFDEYEFFSEDNTPDETGFVPADFRACGAPGSPFNECADYSGPYLVRVRSISGDTVCDPYVIDVSNGVW